jgi:hypothetical protein
MENRSTMVVLCVSCEESLLFVFCLPPPEIFPMYYGRDPQTAPQKKKKNVSNTSPRTLKWVESFLMEFQSTARGTNTFLGLVVTLMNN